MPWRWTWTACRAATSTTPAPRQTGLEDILFRYGVRLPPVLALDLSSTRISMVTGRSADGAERATGRFPLQH